MTGAEFARLEAAVANARRAVKAAGRLNRIASGAVAELAAELQTFRQSECVAERGPAHDHQHHREPVHA
jgi:hypothetical protein